MLIHESRFLIKNYICFLFLNYKGRREKSAVLLLNTCIVIMGISYRVLFCRRAWAVILGRKRYVVKHNLITEVYLMTVMETTTCFGLYWPSSGCLGNLRASYITTPHLPRTTPPPLQIELLSSLYSCILYYYLYLLCFIVFYLTPVLIRFVRLCVCRDLYTMRARMRIASS